MVSRTFAAIGLMLLPTALASNCNSSFGSAKEICETFQDENNPLSMCIPECLGPINTSLALCNNGEMYHDDGEGAMKSIEETLRMILGMCSDPCQGEFMAIQSSGCIPQEGSDFDSATVCSENCKGTIGSFPADCHEVQIPGANMSYGKGLESLQMMCDPCMQGFMGLSMACNGDGKMCTPYCTGLLSKATADCAQSSAAVDVNGQMMSISALLSGYSLQVLICPPSPAPAPTPGSAGCMKIPKAMAEKWSAKRCSGL